MLGNITLVKTIKTTSIILAAALFLTACSTSSTTEDPDTGTDATASNGTSATVTTGGSNNSGVGDGVVAPTANVFYFDFNSSALRADSRSLLDAHAAALVAKPKAVRLEGHADERGTREYNIALGERRAQSVRAYLLSKGVTSSMEVISYGEEKPAASGSNSYAWQQNRRVEIK
ncbi:MAG: peptidoglycan-associated lipoprotein [Granulosicoccus sp.]|jgi:peptidoglycan-associated lipoprotein